MFLYINKKVSIFVSEWTWWRGLSLSLKPPSIFAARSILDVWQGYQYVSVLPSPGVLWIVSVRERKQTNKKKKKQIRIFLKSSKALIVRTNKRNYRSSRPDLFCKKIVLRNFGKFTGKHLCKSLFFNKVAGWLKKGLWHRCFPVNFAKFLRTPFRTEHHWWLLLELIL